MGSRSSTSGGGGGGRKSKTTTSGYQGTISAKKNILTPMGMGPAESIARSGTTGLATATRKEAETIKAATGKSFNAISKNIGEVGSKYRRPADVEKYAKELKTIEEGKAKGAKTFVGPDGVERVSFVGTGMKDEEGRTILSKTTPTLTAKAPTLKELGGDIARGLVGYNTLEYTDESNVPTMVKKKGLIPTVLDAAIGGKLSPVTAITSAIGTNFFSYSDGDKSESPTTTTPETTTEFAESEAEAERKRKLAGSLVSSATKGRSLFQTKNRTITSGMA